MPQPSRGGPAAPPRRAKPAKLKRMSVGTLALMPSSSHMPVLAPSPPFLASLPVRSRDGQAGSNDDGNNPGDHREAEDLHHGQVLRLIGKPKRPRGGPTNRSGLRRDDPRYVGPIGWAQRTAPVPAVDRAPGVLVRLLPAQKVELAAALPCGFTDGVGQKHAARALRSGTRIEAAQVSVRPPTVGKAVVHTNDAALDPEPVQPEHLGGQEAGSGLQVKPLHLWRAQDPRLVAGCPALAMQVDQSSDQIGHGRKACLDEVDLRATL